MVKQESYNGEKAARGPRSNYGFRVQSPHPMKFLRKGGGDEILDIRAGTDGHHSPDRPALMEWRLQGTTHEVSAKLYSEAEHVYRYWISDVGWYAIDSTKRTIGIPTTGDQILREHRLWGVPALLCAMDRNDFFLHAAAAEIDGGAVLFAAPGRHGKTTLALAFHREGYRVLSEDSACCRLAPSPVLLPGPALLRIRRDMFDGRAPEGTSIVASYDDRIYLALNEDRRGSNEPVPIKGIVFLRDAANDIHLEPVAAQKALPDLWALGFRLPNDSARARSFTQLSGLAAGVPIYNLYRPMRISSLGATVAAIKKRVSGNSNATHGSKSKKKS